MNLPPIKLPSDGEEALSDIAGYLRTVRNDRERQVFENGEPVGFWQTDEWIDGLFEISEQITKRPIVPPPPAEIAKALERLQHELAITSETSEFSADIERICNAYEALRQKYRAHREAIFLLLKTRDCWAKGAPEIPDQLSAQFDIMLSLARRIVNLITGKEQAELNV